MIKKKKKKKINYKKKKKKKKKKKEKKTFITNALGKMKHNDSESDDEGDY